MTTAPISPADDHTPRSRPRVILWTVLFLVAAIAIVLTLSVLDDVRDQPLFDSPLLQQTISTIALLGAAFGPSLYANRQDTKVIRHEVKNDHSENMRVENDSRHAETERWFAELRSDLSGFRQDVGGIRAELRHDREAVRLGFSNANTDIRALTVVVNKLEKGLGNGSH